MPQRRLDLEQVGAGVGRTRASALRCTVVQVFVQAALQPLKMLGRLVLIAPAKQGVATGLETLADHAGLTCTAGDAGEVAQQVRPAHLALLQADEVITRVTVAHDHALGLLAQQRLGRHLTARGIKPEMRAPVAHLRPRPHHVVVTLVAGLVGVAHGLLAHVPL